MADLNVALRVVARDLGSRDVRRAISEVDRAALSSARVQQRSIGTISRTSRQHNSASLRDSQRMHQAREQLGIRSEKSIQREIVRTAVAYRRLEQSGRFSGQELSRVADAATTKIRRLQGEMRRLKHEIGYVIYIAVLLRGTTRGTLKSFYAHFFACKYSRFRRESRSKERL